MARRSVNSERNAVERCGICGCELNRDGEYAKPTIKGRGHATKHHYVAERFFGRSMNRPRTRRPAIFEANPWTISPGAGVFCYECHEELLHNPVLLPEDVQLLKQLVELRGLCETEKPASRDRLAGRIELLHEAIALGLKQLLNRQR